MLWRQRVPLYQRRTFNLVSNIVLTLQVSHFHFNSLTNFTLAVAKGQKKVTDMLLAYSLK